MENFEEITVSLIIKITNLRHLLIEGIFHEEEGTSTGKSILLFLVNLFISECDMKIKNEFRDFPEIFRR